MPGRCCPRQARPILQSCALHSAFTCHQVVCWSLHRQAWQLLARSGPAQGLHHRHPSEPDILACRDAWCSCLALASYPCIPSPPLTPKPEIQNPEPWTLSPASWLWPGGPDTRSVQVPALLEGGVDCLEHRCSMTPGKAVACDLQDPALLRHVARAQLLTPVQLSQMQHDTWSGQALSCSLASTREVRAAALIRSGPVDALNPCPCDHTWSSALELSPNPDRLRLPWNTTDGGLLHAAEAPSLLWTATSARMEGNATLMLPWDLSTRALRAWS